MQMYLLNCVQIAKTQVEDIIGTVFDLPGSQEKVLLDELSTGNQPHQFFHVQAGKRKRKGKKKFSKR